MDRNSVTIVTKAVAVISVVPELDSPAMTVVSVSVTLETAWEKKFF